MALQLDFTRIDNIALKEVQKDPVEAFQKPTEEPKTDWSDLKRTQEIFRAYQKNIRISSMTRSEILQGVLAGEGIYTLFLKAVKCIACMTNEPYFYDKVKSDIETVHGEALLKEEPLEIRLRGLEVCVNKLKGTLTNDVDKSFNRQIKSAIELHEKEIEKIKVLLNKK